MSIEIHNGTTGFIEVIDNSRVLQNITGANGVYNNFHPVSTPITAVIDFELPVMSLTMSGNIAFIESNKLLGRSALLLLDTSVNGYTPDFSLNIKWLNGITPTWPNYQYWQIALQCVDDTNIRGVALGYEYPGQTGSSLSVLTLSGGRKNTGPMPNAHRVFDFNASNTSFGTSLYIRFNPDGSVETGTEISSSTGINWTAAGNWITGGTFTASEYDVRFTNWAHANPGISSTDANWEIKPVADDNWISLDSVRTWSKFKLPSINLQWTGDFEVRRRLGAPPATGSSSWYFSIHNDTFDNYWGI